MLPVVQPGLIAGRLASLKGEDQTLIYLKIKNENPELWNLIKVVLNSEKSEEFKDGYVKAAAQFYKLLSSQDEADEMEAQFS
jgi:hypothetical protein